ncbi:hypothetical protein IQ250_04585 [Pseudanabaenaceae cyanobacterium LEGE 13415]|nr:hypothetical protein [Pseudanabaenaceae cyanobacterium LEGE 13415]
MTGLDQRKNTTIAWFADNGFGKLKGVGANDVRVSFETAFAEISEEEAKSEFDSYRDDVVAYIDGDRKDLKGKYFLLGESAKYHPNCKRLFESDSYKSDMFLLFAIFSANEVHDFQTETVNLWLAGSVPDASVTGKRLAEKTKGWHKARIGNKIHIFRAIVAGVINEGSKVGGQGEFITIDFGRRTALPTHWRNGRSITPAITNEGVQKFLDHFQYAIRQKMCGMVEIDVIEAALMRWEKVKTDVPLKGEELEKAKAEGKSTTREAMVYPPLMIKDMNVDREYTETLALWLEKSLKQALILKSKQSTEVPIYAIGGGTHLPKIRPMLKKFGVIVNHSDPVFANALSGFQYFFHGKEAPMKTFSEITAPKTKSKSSSSPKPKQATEKEVDEITDESEAPDQATDQSTESTIDVAGEDAA